MFYVLADDFDGVRRSTVSGDEPQGEFSNNWKKKACVQRIHTRVGNARHNYLHKATTTISQNHAMVCIEGLQVRNMSKSAAGSTEAPDKNVRAKTGSLA